MTSRLLEQEFVTHLFAPLDAPDTDLALRQVTQLWKQCRTQLSMVRSIPGTGLPADLPADPRGAPDGALAGLQDGAADFQAIVRRERDVLGFSMLMATPLTPPRWRMRVGAATPDWTDYTRWWRDLTAGGLSAMLGGATVYQAKSSGGAETDVRGQLPPTDSDAAGWWIRGTAVDNFHVWEVTPDSDPPLRRLIILAPPDEDERLGRLTWNGGDAALPPLGRYLMHAAKLRHHARAHGTGQETARVQDRSLARLNRITTLLGDPVAGDALADEVVRLAVNEAEMIGMLETLRRMRRGVEIARRGMAAALPGGLPTDVRLISMVAQRLDDDEFYLRGIRVQTKRTLSLLSAATPSAPAEYMRNLPAAAPTSMPESAVKQQIGIRVEAAQYPASPPSAEPLPIPAATPARRDVLVIHGDCEPVRSAVFDFLRAIGLRPLEWEHLVARTGSPAPHRDDVVRQALVGDIAVVVLIAEGDMPQEASMFTGMALAAKPDETVLVRVEGARMPELLAGRDAVRLGESVRGRHQLAERLRGLGYAVHTEGIGWLDPKRIVGD